MVRRCPTTPRLLNPSSVIFWKNEDRHQPNEIVGRQVANEVGKLREAIAGVPSYVGRLLSLRPML